MLERYVDFWTWTMIKRMHTESFKIAVANMQSRRRLEWLGRRSFEANAESSRGGN